MPKEKKIPAIQKAITEYNQRIDAREKQVMLEMIARWKELDRVLSGYILGHVEAIQERIEQGLPVGETAFTRLESWRELQRQVVTEARRYEDFAEGVIRKSQLAAAEDGINAALAALRAGGQLAAAAGIKFDQLPLDAIISMIGITADGSPLFDVLARRALAPEMIDGLRAKLIEAIGLGYNPRKTAEMMAEGLAQGLNKALVIARTEQIRAYRTGSQAQYQRAGITMYQRHAAMNERTCLACIALDGQVTPVKDMIASHPNCRCYVTPVIPGVGNPKRSVRDWFEKQDEELQRMIMGNTRYDLWQDGTPLDDFVTTREDSTWGAQTVIVPIKELPIANTE